MIYTYSNRFRFSSVLDSTIHKLYALQSRPLSSSLESISTSTNQHSFTVNYLKNSCGLSPETAISASKNINFKTLDNPDSVLSLFKNHGFSKTQISVLTRKQARLLLWNPNKILLPKFEFFYSKGISSTELAHIVSTTPSILTRSLKDQIIPSFNLLKTLFRSDVKFIAAFIRYPWILVCRRSSIEILRQQGVPDSNIVYLLTTQSRSVSLMPGRLNKAVEDVKKMGINPWNIQFVIAIQALTSMSKSTWKRKMKVYEKCGCSEEETMWAFKIYPWCMKISEEKIMAALSFYANTMGWETSVIIRNPQLMSFTLSKRVIPRCSILQVLLSKGLIKKPVSAMTLLMCRESLFLEKFVTCYEEAPQLLKLYQEKLDLSKLHGHDYEGKSETYQL